MSHYETLGVPKNATPDDIKKAYRKMAMKHHPDRNGGDETEFKRVQEAYEVLGDPDKKAQYDNPQPDFGGIKFNFGGGFDDMFADAFSRFRNHPQRNPDSRVDIQIGLLDAYNGTDYTLNLNTGQINIKIPAGVREGTKLRVAGKGVQRFSNLPAGDLYITIHIVMPRDWGRDGDDLYVRAQIDAISAMIGKSVEVSHITGKKYRVEIPPGIQAGEKVRLKGLGMINPSNSIVGSLYVVVDILIPTITDRNDVELLNTIRGKLDGH